MKQKFLNWIALRFERLKVKVNLLEYDIRVVVLNPNSSHASEIIAGIKFSDAVERNVFYGDIKIDNESVKTAIGLINQIKNDAT